MLLYKTTPVIYANRLTKTDSSSTGHRPGSGKEPDTASALKQCTAYRSGQQPSNHISMSRQFKASATKKTRYSRVKTAVI